MRSWGALTALLGFQAVWLTSVVSAAHGWAVPGLAAAGLFIAVMRGTGQSMVGWPTILACGVAGAIMESALGGAGLVGYAAPWPGPPFAPIWVVALWLSFGSVLQTTSRLLGPHRLLKAAALGAIFGPLSYAAGQRLGAAVIMEPSWVAYCAIAAGWGLSLPALLAFQQWLDSCAGEKS